MATKASTLKINIVGGDVSGIKAFRELAVEAAKTDARLKETAEAFIAAEDRMSRKAEQTAARVKASRTSASDGLRSSALSKVEGLATNLPGGGMLSNFGGASQALEGVSTGAVAAAGAVAAVGAAAVVAGQKSVAAFQDIGGQVQQFAFLTGQSAEASSGWVGALNASGIGVDQWVDRVRQFQTNLAQSEERFSKAGIAVRKFSDGTTDATGMFWDAIQKLHDIPDIVERQRTAFQLFGESWTQLRTMIDDPDAFTALRANFEGTFTQQDLDNLREYNKAVGEFKTQVTAASAEIGGKLVPALTTSLGAAEELIIRAKDLGGTLADIVPGDMGLTEVAQAIPGVSQAIVAVGMLNNAHKDREEKAKAAAVEEQHLKDATAEAAAAAQAAAIAHNAATAALYAEGTAGQSTARILRDVAAAHGAAGSAAFGALVDSERASADQHDRYVDAMASVDAITSKAAATAVDSSEKIQSAADGVANAQRAAGKAAEAVGKAERDGAKQIAEAQDQIVEAYAAREEAQRELGTTIEDVNRDIARFERDAAETIIDAQQKITDAREKAAEGAINGARKIEDAQHALQRAQLAALTNDNPLEASDNIAEAARDLARARDDVSRSAEDDAEDVANAIADRARTERKLMEQRADLARESSAKVVAAQERVTESTKDIGKAQEALAETQEGVSERIVAAQEAAATAADGVTAAQQGLDKAYSDTNTTVGNTIVSDGDKEKKLRDIIKATYDEVAAAQARGASEEEIQGILNNSRIKVDELGVAWDIPVEKIGAYQTILKNIPTRVDTAVVLSMSTSQFRTALDNAALDLQDLGSQANAAMGGEMVGGTMPVPQFRSQRAIGGPVYAGQSYDVHPGETLVMGSTSGYVARDGAGGPTIVINVNAPFYGDERRLAEEIAKAARRGNGR